MAAITWRNLNAGNTSGANSLIKSGFNDLGSAPEGLNAISAGMQQEANFNREQAAQQAAQTAMAGIMAAKQGEMNPAQIFGNPELGNQAGAIASLMQQRMSFLQGQANDKVQNKLVEARTTGQGNKNTIGAAEAEVIEQTIKNRQNTSTANTGLVKARTADIPLKREQVKVIADMKDSATRYGVKTRAASAAAGRSVSVANNKRNNAERNEKNAMPYGSFGDLLTFQKEKYKAEHDGRDPSSKQTKQMMLGIADKGEGYAKAFKRHIEHNAPSSGMDGKGNYGGANVRTAFGSNVDKKDVDVVERTLATNGNTIFHDGATRTLDKETKKYLLKTIAKKMNNHSGWLKSSATSESVNAIMSEALSAGKIKLPFADEKRQNKVDATSTANALAERAKATKLAAKQQRESKY